MLISKLLKENLNMDVVAVGEKEVDCLGLNVSKTDMATATFMVNDKYIHSMSPYIKTIIVSEDVYENLKDKGDFGYCIVKDPKLAFYALHNSLVNDDRYIRKGFKTEVGSDCKISNMSSIAENNVKIGNNVIIEEFAVIRENTVIGDDSIIRAGSVIGGEGYGLFKDEGSIIRQIHLGGVNIGRNVEIQYNSCIDKAIFPWDDTVIEDEVKIDNLVHVGHGIKIGRGTMVVAHAAIGGRTEIGENGWIGLNATLRNGITVGDGARANMGSVVTKPIEANQNVSGNFAVDHKIFINHIKKIK